MKDAWDVSINTPEAGQKPKRGERTPMLDILVAAWLEMATVRAMALSPADPAPLMLVVNTPVPPAEARHEISRRAACRAFPGDDVLTYLLVQARDDDGAIVPAAFHTETVKCNTSRASVEQYKVHW